MQRHTVREGLARHKTIASKLKYILFAFKFELIVAAVILGFAGFFTL